MKILITGVSGFIGVAVLKEAIRRYGGENIIALTSSQTDENVKVIFHNGYNFDPNIFVDSDLSDIDTLVHIGAFTPKDQTESNDILKCNSNIVNTEKLLYSNFPNLKKIVFLSTIDVYPTADLISEETEERPISLYGYSKLYCEKMIQRFAEKYKLIYQILRIGHVFGPGEEKYKKIIPVTISKLLTNKEIEIFGDGQAIRTFIYLDDVAKSILNALDLPKSEGIINVVGESQTTIEGLIKILVEIHGDSNAIIKYDSSITKNRNLIFDNYKLKKKLFNHFTPLADGLRTEYLYMKEKIIRESVF